MTESDRPACRFVVLMSRLLQHERSPKHANPAAALASTVQDGAGHAFRDARRGVYFSAICTFTVYICDLYFVQTQICFLLPPASDMSSWRPVFSFRQSRLLINAPLVDRFAWRQAREEP